MYLADTSNAIPLQIFLSTRSVMCYIWTTPPHTTPILFSVPAPQIWCPRQSFDTPLPHCRGLRRLYVSCSTFANVPALLHAAGPHCMWECTVLHETSQLSLMLTLTLTLNLTVLMVITVTALTVSVPISVWVIIVINMNSELFCCPSMQ